eukprot:TRINITY_DN65042_c0_g1_i1.p1 TRINITY_DN65042_c0_g1~~TRINITY_DN65042_c0_g1_i1.p1  ORF type:complete len:536 (+),score=141.81 TRINITY_DN65042_c0_g1_i1:73-1608(+)
MPVVCGAAEGLGALRSARPGDAVAVLLAGEELHADDLRDAIRGTAADCCVVVPDSGGGLGALPAACASWIPGLPEQWSMRYHCNPSAPPPKKKRHPQPAVLSAALECALEGGDCAIDVTPQLASVERLGRELLVLCRGDAAAEPAVPPRGAAREAPAVHRLDGHVPSLPPHGDVGRPGSGAGGPPTSLPSEVLYHLAQSGMARRVWLLQGAPPLQPPRVSPADRAAGQLYDGAAEICGLQPDAERSLDRCRPADASEDGTLSEQAARALGAIIRGDPAEAEARLRALWKWLQYNLEGEAPFVAALLAAAVPHCASVYAVPFSLPPGCSTPASADLLRRPALLAAAVGCAAAAARAESVLAELTPADGAAVDWPAVRLALLPPPADPALDAGGLYLMCGALDGNPLWRRQDAGDAMLWFHRASGAWRAGPEAGGEGHVLLYHLGAKDLRPNPPAPAAPEGAAHPRALEPQGSRTVPAAVRRSFCEARVESLLYRRPLRCIAAEHFARHPAGT